MPWRVEFKPAARRQFAKLEKVTRKRVFAALERMAMELSKPDEPRQSDVKMGGTVNDYRLRVGGYRVIFRPDGAALIVTVIEVEKRGDVY